MKTGTIRQLVNLPANPDEVFAALMTTKGHEGFTGAPARISRREGGSFMAWGGYIHGKNITLVPGRRIVQSWRPSEETWPPRHLSKVSFVLVRTREGTRLRFTHTGVPLEHVGHLSDGWKESYWQPLAKYLKASTKKGTTRPRRRSGTRR